jgi:Fur family transcriptional regulator, peroxide stress response regulator
MVMAKRLDKALQKLKSNGVRMTPQRHAILSYLMNTLEHPTADIIYKNLSDRFPNMSVATVYNNLRLFKEAGLVKEMTYGDSSSRFDANPDDHYHVICKECGKVVDFDCPSLDNVEQMACEQTGFKVDSHRMEVYGICAECLEKKLATSSKKISNQ